MCQLGRANVSSSGPDVSSFWPDVSTFRPNVSTLAGEVSVEEGGGERVGAGGWEHLARLDCQRWLG